MHQDGLVYPVRKLPEQLRAGVARVSFRHTGHTCDQVIHGGGERGDLRLIGGNVHSSAQSAAHCNLLQLLRELPYSLQVTSLQPIEYEQERSNERQQKAQKAHYRHLVLLKAPVESAFSRGLVFLVTL